MNTLEKININEILGHHVDAIVNLCDAFGYKSEYNLTGRIIYSEYNASLFFKPKGSRNKGYLIKDEDDILEVKIIRKDNKMNEYYVNLYKQKEFFEKKKEERLAEEQKEREEQEKLRKKIAEVKKKKEQEAIEKEIEEAKALGGYEELEKEVIEFYESSNEHYNKKFVETIVVPILNKLIHKAISNVNCYPKYIFCKKSNTRFCKLIEKYLNIKLTNVQKKNVEIINNYLNS